LAKVTGVASVIHNNRWKAGFFRSTIVNLHKISRLKFTYLIVMKDAC